MSIKLLGDHNIVIAYLKRLIINIHIHMQCEKVIRYPDRIQMHYLTRKMRMIDPMIICVETPRHVIGCSLGKEFIELIRMNHRIILYMIIN